MHLCLDRQQSPQFWRTSVHLAAACLLWNPLQPLFPFPQQRCGVTPRTLGYQVEKGTPFIKHEAAFIYLIIEGLLFHQRGRRTLEEGGEQFQALLGTIKGRQPTANGEQKTVRAPVVENSPLACTDLVSACGSFRPSRCFSPNTKALPSDGC